MPTLDHAFFGRETFKFWNDDHVRFSDLDALGHVNNLSIGQYFENARVALFTALMPNWPQRAQLFVLANLTIDYVRELHYPAKVQVGTRLIKFGRSSMYGAAAVFRGDDMIAACTTVSVFIDEKTRQPTEIPAALRELITGTAG